jgi:ribosomal protein S18 acetylase RimI-like enzyme
VPSGPSEAVDHADPRGGEIPDHVIGFWRDLDTLFGTVEPTWWGAVVTDARFPAIWDANYARVDVASEEVRARDLDRALLPALRAAGTDSYHVVSFHPERTRTLITELTTRGHRLTWDLVMDRPAGPGSLTIGVEGTLEVEELADGDELWEAVTASLPSFGVDAADAAEQLRSIERDVMLPGGKRWFGLRDDRGAIVSIGAHIVLGDVGYVDNVATVEQARRRGYASAVTAHLVNRAQDAGAHHVCLFADPESAGIVRMYKRIGFRPTGRLAATRGPIEI